MSELRLVPAALVVWAVTLLLLLTGSLPAAAGLVVVAAACLAVLRQPGQAVLAAVLGAAALVLTRTRQRGAGEAELGDVVTGTVAAQPTGIAPERHLVRLHVPGHPAELPVFTGELPAGVVAGARVTAEVALSPSDRPGLGAHVASGELRVEAEPAGMAAFAAHVRQTFGESVAAVVGPASQGLVPGMVLGDTSGQSAAEQQLYIDTGLSHLSAVSGANVAIVTTAAVVVCRLLTLGPRVQVAAASGALLVFVGLVGTEPSVLRASVTGLVGLLAVLNSARMEPVHGLCLAVIGLILWDPDLAVSYGFALSVAATAGIVALHPLLYRPLARTRLPDILVRALAVAVAADIVTMPIIAVMAGEVSLVSVVANVLVAPAVAPVTVLGLIAAGLCLLPGGLEIPPLKMLEPCTWWIHTVAQWCAQLPNATVPADPGWVLVGYGWVLAAVLAGHPWKVLAGVGVFFLWSLHAGAGTGTGAAEIPLETLPERAVAVVGTVGEVDTAPPGTQVIIVLDDTGRASDRPTVTRAGVPVLFPHRDGEVSLHRDGTQHARDGRF
ncbi:ComEC/Rec2 family competence protein [Corynebacterium halotolerans]|uniref:ComEC/Rec2-related protein domain-containing protein n=1 Tax=Corynebacterium halotolerans YIM 70093 = DSM 44683 TaxID=1121362 RepID=M1P919_9CORY|nr:ComEC/Rec2 family competence protein [Corynebacterium halotolerans]AGF73176.1 hypothetical protein A605_10880 [Corynebacterium halotolerans YIM 70093 = DSM 44683]